MPVKEYADKNKSIWLVSTVSCTDLIRLPASNRRIWSDTIVHDHVS